VTPVAWYGLGGDETMSRPSLSTSSGWCALQLGIPLPSVPHSAALIVQCHAGRPGSPAGQDVDRRLDDDHRQQSGDWTTTDSSPVTGLIVRLLHQRCSVLTFGPGIDVVTAPQPPPVPEIDPDWQSLLRRAEPLLRREFERYMPAGTISWMHVCHARGCSQSLIWPSRQQVSLP
jgi:hypothetical protein